MSEGKIKRLNKVLRELNISLDRAVEHLSKNGHEIEARPTTKISEGIYQVLLEGFQTDKTKKAASKEVGEEKRKEKEAIRLELEAKLEKKRIEEEAKKEVLKAKAEKLEIKTVGKIDIDVPVVKKEEQKEPVAAEVTKTEAQTKEVVVEKPVEKEAKKEVKKSTVKAPIEREATKKVVSKKGKSVSKEEESVEISAEKA
jgi:translation initiation factor IF-2